MRDLLAFGKEKDIVSAKLYFCVLKHLISALVLML